MRNVFHGCCHEQQTEYPIKQKLLPFMRPHSHCASTQSNFTDSILEQHTEKLDQYHIQCADIDDNLPHFSTSFFQATCLPQAFSS